MCFIGDILETFTCLCTGIYFFFVIVLCVMSAVTTALVMQLHIRAESVPVTRMTPWVSDFARNTV